MSPSGEDRRPRHDDFHPIRNCELRFHGLPRMEGFAQAATPRRPPIGEPSLRTGSFDCDTTSA